jgi:hypothetical protein
MYFTFSLPKKTFLQFSVGRDMNINSEQQIFYILGLEDKKPEAPRSL